MRLMPSQLPGSSLMMPTLVFQVVQFTSSTLQGEEMGEQGAGSLRALPAFQVEGLGPQAKPKKPSNQDGETAGGGGRGDRSAFGHHPGDMFSDHTMGSRDFKYWILGSVSNYQVTLSGHLIFQDLMPGSHQLRSKVGPLCPQLSTGAAPVPTAGSG